MSYFIADFGRKVRLISNNKNNQDPNNIRWRNEYRQYDKTPINNNAVKGSNVNVSKNTSIGYDNKRFKITKKRATVIDTLDANKRPIIDRDYVDNRFRSNVNGETGGGIVDEIYNRKTGKTRTIPRKQKPLPTPTPSSPTSTTSIKQTPKLSRKNMLLLGVGLTSAALYAYNKRKNKNNK